MRNFEAGWRLETLGIFQVVELCISVVVGKICNFRSGNILVEYKITTWLPGEYILQQSP